MYGKIQQNMMTQETDHTKRNGENNTSITLRSQLILDVTQHRLEVTFHNISNKLPNYTE